jgi:hypothetical protein
MVLSFEASKKLRNAEMHNEMFQSNAGINGTYVPNMSEEDKNKWKAKHIKGDDERIEIRKTIGGTQLLIVVYKKEYQPKYPKYSSANDPKAYAKYKERMAEWYKRHQNIRMSMNGKLDMTYVDCLDMTDAIKEAIQILS